MRPTPAAALLVLALLVLAVASCGDGAAPTTTFGADPPLPPLVTSTAAAAPAPPLEFVPTSLAGGIEAPVPAGWLEDERFPGLFRPPAGGALDPAVTQWWVTATCAGPCGERSAAEWALTVEEDLFAQFYDAEAFTIRRNEELADGALILAENNFDLLALHIARWADGAGEILTCQLSLPVPHEALLAGFETACQAVSAPILDG